MKNYIFISILFLFSISTAQAIIINVPGDYTTIQQAIYYANNSDEIQVEAGTYEENIVIENKTITLTGLDPDPANTVIDGQSGATVVRIQATGVIMKNFALINAVGVTGANDPTWGGTGGDGIGIKLNYAYNCLLENNIIYHIRGGIGGNASTYYGFGGMGGSGIGIFINKGSSNTIFKNKAIDIQGGMGGSGGIYGTGGSGGYAWGIYVLESNYNTLKANDVFDNIGGVGEDGYDGGAGGLGAGFYLKNSNSISMVSPGDHNIAYNNQGGSGGDGSVTPGYDGIGMGVYIDNTFSSQAHFCNFFSNDVYNISSNISAVFNADTNLRSR